MVDVPLLGHLGTEKQSYIFGCVNIAIHFLKTRQKGNTIVRYSFCHELLSEFVLSLSLLADRNLFFAVIRKSNESHCHRMPSIVVVLFAACLFAVSK